MRCAGGVEQNRWIEAGRWEQQVVEEVKIRHRWWRGWNKCAGGDEDKNKGTDVDEYTCTIVQMTDR